MAWLVKGYGGSSTLGVFSNFLPISLENLLWVASDGFRC